MGPVIVVVIEIGTDGGMEFRAGGEVAWVDQFVFDGAPKAFDEDVVESPSATVHADEDVAILERTQEIARGELGALVGVEDIGNTPAKGAVEGGEAQGGIDSIGDVPTEHKAAEPVDHGGQVKEAVAHGDVSNIGAPHLIGSCYWDIAK